MVLDGLQQDVISFTGQLAQTWMQNMDGKIEQMDTLVNGAAQILVNVTDDDVKTVFPDLTKQQILDVIYVMKLARNDIRGNLPSVVLLANLR